VGLAKLARDQNKLDLKGARNSKRPEVAAVKDTRDSQYGATRGLAPSRIPHEPDTLDDDGWESASDDESDFSVDSRLAYDNSTKRKWKNFFGRKKYKPKSRKETVVDPRLFGPQNSLHGHVDEPVGFGDVSWNSSTDFGQSSTFSLPIPTPVGPSQSAGGSQQSLKQVEPVPTSDSVYYDAGRGSVMAQQYGSNSTRPGPAPVQYAPSQYTPGQDSSRFDDARNSAFSGAEPYISRRPEPITLQQPQPIPPRSQTILEPSYPARAEPSPTSILKKTTSSGRGSSVAQSALVGLGGIAAGAIAASALENPKDRRREEDERAETERLRRRDEEAERAERERQRCRQEESEQAEREYRRRRDEELEQAERERQRRREEELEQIERERLRRRNEELEQAERERQRRLEEESVQLERERLRRLDSEKKDSKDGRQREKRSSPDRNDRSEKIREKDRRKDESDEKRREKKREKRREDARDEKDDKWENRRDETREERDERRERRREERRSERSDFDSRVSKSEVSTSSAAVDPFPYQLRDDTPSIPSAESHRQVDSAPSIITVERSPDFTRMRSSSIKEQSSTYEPPSPYFPPPDERSRDREERDRPLRKAEEFYHEARESTAPYDAAIMTSAIAAVVIAEEERKSRSQERRNERRGEGTSDFDEYANNPADKEPAREKERDPVQEEADRAYREIVMARKIASHVARSGTPSPNRSVTEKYDGDEEEPIVRIVTPPEMADHDRKKKGPYDAPNADFRPDYEFHDPRELHDFSIPEVNMVRSLPQGTLPKRDHDTTEARPLLNLVWPTPTPSPAPEEQSARSEASPRRVRSKSRDREEAKRAYAPGAGVSTEREPTPTAASDVVTGASPSAVSKAVTWGVNETKHYEVETPSDHKEEFMSNADVPTREIPEEIKQSSSSKTKGWGAIAAGIIGAGIGAVAAGSSDSSITSKAKGEEKQPESAFEYRGVMVEPEPDSPPRSQRKASPPREQSRTSPPAPGPKPTGPISAHIPGAFDDDIDFTAHVAAGLKDTGFDPDIVINDPAFRRRDSPPGSNEIPIYRSPFAETVSDLGTIPSEVSGARSMTSGFIIGEVAETPQDWRSVSPPRNEETPTKISRKEQKKRDKARRQSGEVTPLDEPSISKDVVKEPESYFVEPKLSKKEQKKRDKEAQRQRSLDEDTTPHFESSVTEQVVAEPDSYFVTPKKSKKSKDVTSSFDNDLDNSTRSTRTVSVPVDELPEYQNGDDEWTAETKKSKSKRDSDRYDSPSRTPSSEVAANLSRSSSVSKRAKRDTDRYESPSRSVPSFEVGVEERSSSRKSKHGSERYDSPARSEVASEVGSSKKSRDKSKRRSESYEVDPTEVSLPPTTPSEISEIDDRRTRKSPGRDSGEFNSADRGDSRSVGRSVVSAGTSRYDEDEPRKSKKKSRNGTKDDFDDTRSVVSAPVGDDHEDSKKSKKREKEKDKEKEKEKEKKSSGFFSFFGGSKPESSVRDESPKRSKDDVEHHKKKKRSRTNYVPSDLSFDGDVSVTSASDLSRTMSVSTGKSNGHGAHDYDQYEDGTRSDGEREKKKSRSRSASTSSKKGSFLGNAGTLGAGAGIAGAAVAIAAQHYQQSKAANTNDSETAEGTRSMSLEGPSGREEDLDPDIRHRDFRPSIDPQYGDLLPLPPSDPATPILQPLDDLPELPGSRPDTPEADRVARERAMSSISSFRKSLQETPTKSPSQSAVPLKFILGNRSSPPSPSVVRASPTQSPAVTNQETFSFPKFKSRPTSWEATKEYRPLYLVESHRRGSQAPLIEAEEAALPPSHATSRSSSQHDLPQMEMNWEDPYDHSINPLAIDAALAYSAAPGLLGSGQSTPKAAFNDPDNEELILQTPTRSGDDHNLQQHREESPSVQREGKSHFSGEDLAAAVGVAGLATAAGYLLSSSSPKDEKTDELPSIERQPSPVDPMTKDRSSYLLQSSPISRNDRDSLEYKEASPTRAPKHASLDSDALYSIHEHEDPEALSSQEIQRQRDKALESLSGTSTPFEALAREAPTRSITQQEPSEELPFTKSKKDQKKDKKKNKGLSKSSTQDELPTFAEASENPQSEIPAPVEAEVADEIVVKSNKDKKKNKRQSKLVSALGDAEELPQQQSEEPAPALESIQELPEDLPVSESMASALELGQELPKDLADSMPQALESSKELPKHLPISERVPLALESNEELPRDLAIPESTPQALESSEVLPKDLVTSDSMPQALESSEELPRDLAISESAPQALKSQELSEDIASSESMPLALESSKELSKDLATSDSVPQALESSEELSKDLATSDTIPQALQAQELPEDLVISESGRQGLESSQELPRDLATPESMPQALQSQELPEDLVTSESMPQADIEPVEALSVPKAKKDKKGKKKSKSISAFDETEDSPQQFEEPLPILDSSRDLSESQPASEPVEQVEVEPIDNFSAPKSKKDKGKKKNKSISAFDETDNSPQQFQEPAPILESSRDVPKSLLVSEDVQPVDVEPVDDFSAPKVKKDKKGKKKSKSIPSQDDTEDMQQPQVPISELSQVILEETPDSQLVEPVEELSTPKSIKDKGKSVATYEPEPEIQLEDNHDEFRDTLDEASRNVPVESISAPDILPEVAQDISPETIATTVNTRDEPAHEVSEPKSKKDKKKNKKSKSVNLELEEDSTTTIPSEILLEPQQDVVQDTPAPVDEASEDLGPAKSKDKKGKKNPQVVSSLDFEAKNLEIEAAESMPEVRDAPPIVDEQTDEVSFSKSKKDKKKDKKKSKSNSSFEPDSRALDETVLQEPSPEISEEPTSISNDLVPETQADLAIPTTSVAETDLPEPVSLDIRDLAAQETSRDIEDVAQPKDIHGIQSEPVDTSIPESFESVSREIQPGDDQDSAQASSAVDDYAPADKKKSKKKKRKSGLSQEPEGDIVTAEASPKEIESESKGEVLPEIITTEASSKDIGSESKEEVLPETANSDELFVTDTKKGKKKKKDKSIPSFDQVDDSSPANTPQENPSMDEFQGLVSKKNKKKSNKSKKLEEGLAATISNDDVKTMEPENLLPASETPDVKLTPLGGPRAWPITPATPLTGGEAEESSSKGYFPAAAAVLPVVAVGAALLDIDPLKKDSLSVGHSVPTISEPIGVEQPDQESERAVPDGLKSGYKDDQLSLARKLREEFASGRNSSKKDKKKRQSLPSTPDRMPSRSRAVEDLVDSHSRARSLSIGPSTQRSTQSPAATERKNVYSEDQLEFARQLKAEFDNKKAKKDKKGRKGRSLTQDDDFDQNLEQSPAQDLKDVATVQQEDAEGAPKGDGFAAGYREDQLSLARKLQAEFGKKSKKGKKSRSTSRTPLASTAVDDYFGDQTRDMEAVQPVEPSNVPESSEPVPVRDGLAVGYKEDQIELARQMQEEFAAKKSKKDKKDKKRQSLLRSNTEDEFLSDAPTPDESGNMEKPAENVQQGSGPVSADPEDEIAAVGKKSNKDKKGKKKGNLLRGTADEDLASDSASKDMDEPVPETPSKQDNPDQTTESAAIQFEDELPPNTKKSKKDKKGKKRDSVKETEVEGLPASEPGPVENQEPEGISQDTREIVPEPEEFTSETKKSKKDKKGKKRESMMQEGTEEQLPSESVPETISGSIENEPPTQDLTESREIVAIEPEGELTSVTKKSKKDKKAKKRDSLMPEPEADNTLSESLTAQIESTEAQLNFPDKTPALVPTTDESFIPLTEEPEEYDSKPLASEETPSAEPENDLAPATKKSKKDKKGKKRGSTAPDTLTETLSKEEETSRDLSEGTPAEMGSQMPTQTPTEPVEGDLGFVGKKSKKDKKKRQSIVAQEPTSQPESENTPVHTPATKEPLIADTAILTTEELPISKIAIPITEDLSTSKDLPSAEELPVSGIPIPNTEELSTTKELPNTEELPVSDIVVPTTEELPITDNAIPNTKELPVSEITTPATEGVPIADTATPTNEELPITKIAIPNIEELSVSDSATTTTKELPIPEITAASSTIEAVDVDETQGNVAISKKSKKDKKKRQSITAQESISQPDSDNAPTQIPSTQELSIPDIPIPTAEELSNPDNTATSSATEVVDVEEPQSDLAVSKKSKKDKEKCKSLLQSSTTDEKSEQSIEEKNVPLESQEQIAENATEDTPSLPLEDQKNDDFEQGTKKSKKDKRKRKSTQTDTFEDLPKESEQSSSVQPEPIVDAAIEKDIQSTPLESQESALQLLEKDVTEEGTSLVQPPSQGLFENPENLFGDSTSTKKSKKDKKKRKDSIITDSPGESGISTPLDPLSEPIKTSLPSEIIAETNITDEPEPIIPEPAVIAQDNILKTAVSELASLSRKSSLKGKNKSRKASKVAFEEPSGTSTPREPLELVAEPSIPTFSTATTVIEQSFEGDIDISKDDVQQEVVDQQLDELVPVKMSKKDKKKNKAGSKTGIEESSSAPIHQISEPIEPSVPSLSNESTAVEQLLDRDLDLSTPSATQEISEEPLDELVPAKKSKKDKKKRKDSLKANLDELSEPISEPTLEPASEPISEPSLEPALEPASELVSKPALGPASEPVSEPALEPVLEPVVAATSENLLGKDLAESSQTKKIDDLDLETPVVEQPQEDSSSSSRKNSKKDKKKRKNSAKADLDRPSELAEQISEPIAIISEPLPTEDLEQHVAELSQPKNIDETVQEALVTDKPQEESILTRENSKKDKKKRKDSSKVDLDQPSEPAQQISEPIVAIPESLSTGNFEQDFAGSSQTKSIDETARGAPVTGEPQDLVPLSRKGSKKDKKKRKDSTRTNLEDTATPSIPSEQISDTLEEAVLTSLPAQETAEKDLLEPSLDTTQDAPRNTIEGALDERESTTIGKENEENRENSETPNLEKMLEPSVPLEEASQPLEEAIHTSLPAEESIDKYLLEPFLESTLSVPAVDKLVEEPAPTKKSKKDKKNKKGSKNLDFEKTPKPSGPVDEAFQPMEEAAQPLEASQPLEEAFQPLKETGQPLEEATQPLEEASQPLEASQPVEEASQPLEEASQPLEKAAQLSEQAAQPVEASQPLEEASQPLEASQALEASQPLEESVRTSLPADNSIEKDLLEPSFESIPSVPVVDELVEEPVPKKKSKEDKKKRKDSVKVDSEEPSGSSTTLQAVEEPNEIVPTSSVPESVPEQQISTEQETPRDELTNAPSQDIVQDVAQEPENELGSASTKKFKKNKKKRKSGLSTPIEDLVPAAALPLATAAVLAGAVSESSKKDDEPEASESKEIPPDVEDEWGSVPSKSKKDKKKRQSGFSTPVEQLPEPAQPPDTPDQRSLAVESVPESIERSEDLPSQEIEVSLPATTENFGEGEAEWAAPSEKSKKDKKKRKSGISTPIEDPLPEVQQPVLDENPQPSSSTTKVLDETKVPEEMPILDPVTESIKTKATKEITSPEEMPNLDPVTELTTTKALEETTALEAMPILDPVIELATNKASEETTLPKETSILDPVTELMSTKSLEETTLPKKMPILDPVTEFTTNKALEEVKLPKEMPILDQVVESTPRDIIDEPEDEWAVPSKKSKKDKKKRKSETPTPIKESLSEAQQPILEETPQPSLATTETLEERTLPEELPALDPTIPMETTAREIVNDAEEERAPQKKSKKDKKKRNSGVSTPLEESAIQIQPPALEELPESPTKNFLEESASIEEPLEKDIATEPSTREIVEEAEEERAPQKKSKKDKKKRNSGISTPLEEPAIQNQPPALEELPESLEKEKATEPPTREIIDKAEEERAPIKKSKKDKKKRKSGISTPLEETLPEILQTASEVPQSSSTAKELEQTTLDQPLPIIDAPASEIINKAKEEQALTKESEKDKKNRNSEASTPAEQILEPETAAIDVTKPSLPLEPPSEEFQDKLDQHLPEAASKDTIDETEQLAPTKMSKKDQKKRKSGTATPVEEISEIKTTVLDDNKQISSEPLLEPIGKTSSDITQPIVQDTTTSKDIVNEPNDDWEGASTSKKSKKDKKKRKSGLSTPIEGTQSIQTEALEDSSKTTPHHGPIDLFHAKTTSSKAADDELPIHDQAVVEDTRVPEEKGQKSTVQGTQFQDIPVEEAKDEDALEDPFAFVTKRSKKEKKGKRAAQVDSESGPSASARTMVPLPIETPETNPTSLPEPETFSEQAIQPEPTTIPDIIESRSIPDQEHEPEASSISRKSSKKDKRKRQATIDSTNISSGSVPPPLTSWVDEVEEAQVERSIPVIEEIAKDESLSHIPSTTPSAPSDDYYSRPTKKGKKGKRKDSLKSEPTPVNDSFQIPIGPDMPSNDTKGKQSDAPIIEAAGVAAIAGAALLSKAAGTGTSSDSATPVKLSKKDKKMSIDKRVPREDMFDDPALWEGADPMVYEETKEGPDDEGNDGFWSPPQEEVEEPIIARKPLKEREELATAQESVERQEIAQQPHAHEASPGINIRVEPTSATAIPTMSGPDMHDSTKQVTEERQPEIVQEAFSPPIESSSSNASRFEQSEAVREEFVVPASKKENKDNEPKRLHEREFEESIKQTDSVPTVLPLTSIEPSTEFLGDPPTNKGISFENPPPIIQEYISASSRDLEQQPRIQRRAFSSELERTSPTISRSITPRSSRPRLSDLPIVLEENFTQVEAEHHTLPHGHSTEEANRDSAFVSDSPIPPQRGFADHHEHVRDSGVHLRDNSPAGKIRAPPVSSTDDAIARLSWPSVDEETETVDLHRSQRPIVKAPKKHQHGEDQTPETHDSKRSKAPKEIDFYRSQRVKGEPPVIEQHARTPDNRDQLQSQRTKEESHNELQRTSTIHGRKLKENIVKQRSQIFESPDLPKPNFATPESQRSEIRKLDLQRSQTPKLDKYADLRSSPRPTAQKPLGISEIEAGAAIASATLGFAAARKVSQEKRPESASGQKTTPYINRLRTPDIKRPESVGSNRSGTPPLRRSDRQLSGDLRSLSQRSKPDLAKEAELAAITASAVNTANPTANEGRVRAKDMADVYVRRDS
jgi:hypothetical protein